MWAAFTSAVNTSLRRLNLLHFGIDSVTLMLSINQLLQDLSDERSKEALPDTSTGMGPKA